MSQPAPTGDPAALATAAAGPDARTGLRAALALRRLAETLESLQVANARRQGWSWQEIAAALDVSKQAVHKKYAGRTPDPQTPATQTPATQTPTARTPATQTRED